MKRLVPLAALAALAAPAAAKHITAAQVCGAGGCRPIAHPSERLLMGGVRGAGPTRPSPFVRLRFSMGHGETARIWFFPGPGMVLADDQRTWVRPASLAVLRRLARGVRPFPPRRLPPGIFPPPAPRPARGGGSDWWWALLALPAAAGLALLLRRGGTDGRRAVYRLAGARHGRRPRGARAAR